MLTTTQYDHTPISEGVRNCLLEVARRNPCPRRQQCRSLSCPHGHICQTQNCQRRGGNVYCKLPSAMHSIDMNVAEYVNGMNAVLDDAGSANGSPPSYSSSNEEEKNGHQEGAILQADGADTASLD